METDLVASATPTETLPPVETEAPSAEPTIAEHEAQFGKGAAAPPTEEATPPESRRHRAKSQQASAADVPRIAELTKKLREAERERDEWKAKHAAPAPQPAAPSPVAAPARSEPEKVASSDKPTWKAFEEQIGTKYETWADAQDAFADARDDWKDAQRKKSDAEQSEQRSREQQMESYVTKARAFAATTPDFAEKTAAAAQDFDAAPQLLQAAVITHDNGPEIAYYLATHPDTLVELSLMTDGKAVTPQSVALLQRRLSSYRTAAVPTGSAPVVQPRILAPRPPNPVRTGPLKSSEELPGDDASIAEHEKVWGNRRRR